MWTAAVILGAGYSYVAGLPLARDLLTTDRLYVPSEQVAREWDLLAESFSRWSVRNPEKGVEQYLQYVQAEQFGQDAGLWSAAVRRVAAALATPIPRDIRATNPRYLGNITRPYDCSEHSEFWDILLQSTDVRGVITTNYDLLIERSLRHRQMHRSPYRPGCYYGGLLLPQKIQAPEDPFYRQKHGENLMLEGTIPLYKLHGSLSWSFEWQQLVLYADPRPAFRLQNTCAIIPPVPEKLVPPWLQPIWAAAEASLREARTWIVCGYSLPDYDLSIREILQRAGEGQCMTVYVLDPAADKIRERWQAVTSHAQVVPLPGLPHGTDALLSHLSG